MEHFTEKDLKMVSKDAVVMQFADHAHIVRLKGVSLSRGLLVMELAACSLSDILHPIGTVAPRALAIKQSFELDAAFKLAWKMSVIRDVADAVAYLHAHHILHRDIKSPNVMLFLDAATGRTVAKILDFGLALAVELVSRTAGGLPADAAHNPKAVGTHNYMAPELFDRQPWENIFYSEASDVFSVGILINEAMTEKVPWGGTAREMDVERWVLQQELRPDMWDPNLTRSLPGGNALCDIVGDSDRPHSCLHQKSRFVPALRRYCRLPPCVCGAPLLASPPTTRAPLPGTLTAIPPFPPAVPDAGASPVAPSEVLVTKRVANANGDVYDGQWIEGKFGGSGVMKYASGDVYDGDWKDDKREGHGVYKFADGPVYDGQWKDDKREGHGVMKYAYGSVYDGDWKDDKRVGHGVFKFANGYVYDGVWKDDKREGHGVFKIAGGHVYDGDWKDGRREGHGVFKIAGGHVYDGDWKDDKREGHGVMKYAYGSVYDGEWKDDMREVHGMF